MHFILLFYVSILKLLEDQDTNNKYFFLQLLSSEGIANLLLVLYVAVDIFASTLSLYWVATGSCKLYSISNSSRKVIDASTRSSGHSVYMQLWPTQDNNSETEN